MARRRRLAAAPVLLFFACLPARAGRYIAVPNADTLDAGRYSLWQFGLYDQRGTKKWRSLNRLDIGLYEGVEFGEYAISPRGKPSETWTNVQYRPLKEEGLKPSVSLGAWDVLHKGTWFQDDKAAPSPFLSAGKSYKRGDQAVKGSLAYGFNRLHGLFGGVEVKVLAGTGLLGEYVPRNLRLAGADKWDFGVYQWFGKYVRARLSWMGGNPMGDVFFTYSFRGP